jgi:cytoskeletal protein CcmA (bactofilin family)
MRRSLVLFWVVGAVGLAGLLSACGGGGSPSASASGSGSGSASASGTVTGFGSLYVNGKKFETNDVEVRHDGQSERCSISPSNTCGLKKGMTITVKGSFSNSQHTATSIRQEDAVEGLVQSVAPDKSSLVVMGQSVLVDNTTIIDDNITNHDLATLQAGIDHVEVNGHVLLNGVIQATFIEKKLANVTPEVRGYVSNHVSGGFTFQIGNLIVNYGSADIANMPVPNGNNWDTLFVEVKGATAAAFNPATVTLTASKVEPENQGIGNNVDEFEVEGFVTNVVSVDINTRVARFFIGTTEVQTTSNTEFREGMVDEIVLGAKMSAEGRLENGILIAEEVKFKESARLEGDIDSVTGSAPSFTITIKGLSNVTIKTDSLTRFDGTPTQNTHVRVRGRLNGSSTVVASRIKVESSSKDDVILQGQVQAKADPILTILGVPVDTTGVRFEGLDDGPISRTAFFAAVKANETLAKVKGTLQTNGTVIWDEVELED